MAQLKSLKTDCKPDVFKQNKTVNFNCQREEIPARLDLRHRQFLCYRFLGI